VALDSGFVAPLGHLVQIAIYRDDRAAVRRLWALHAARDSTSDAAVFLRWRVAVALGDSAAARRVESGLDSLPPGVLRRIAEWGQMDGVRCDVAYRAARAYHARAVGNDLHYAERVRLMSVDNAGRWRERLELIAALSDRVRQAVDTVAARFSFAMWFDGDPADIPLALAELETRGTNDPAAQRLAMAMRSVARGSPPDPAGAQWQRWVREAPLWARALAAARSRDGAARELVASVDSARRRAVHASDANFWALIQARAWLALGEPERAADAASRRSIETGGGAQFLAALLRVEGDALLLASDTAGAIRAYRHYLALRHDPDPGARVWSDSVRAALARLEGRR
jgi:hypothetical protein